MLTRLRESCADAFTIMRIAGQPSVTVSQRYADQSLETAFERMDALKQAQRGEASGVGTTRKASVLEEELSPL